MICNDNLSKKHLLIYIDGMKIFTDETYRCDWWAKNDYSLWKIIDGYFYTKHTRDMSYVRSHLGSADKIINALKKIDEEIEKIVL